jgi:TatD DNase family protein
MSKLPLFDSHAHVEGEDFDQDREQVLKECGETLEGLINPGFDRDSSLKAMDLAHSYPFVYAAVGWHPEEVGRCTDQDIKDMEAWCADPKVVAIGEIGLDYYNDEGAPHDLQKLRFIQQLELAKKVNLPVIIHDREAHGDLLEILQKEGKGVTGIMHCYSGSLEMAKVLLKMGWYFGFGGATTFKNSKKAREVLTWLPEDRILFETDTPYMTPVPFRGTRNKPIYTELVARNTALLRGSDPIELMRVTTHNLKQLCTKIV